LAKYIDAYFLIRILDKPKKKSLFRRIKDALGL
jgi:hypothetical protein